MLYAVREYAPILQPCLLTKNYIMKGYSRPVLRLLTPHSQPTAMAVRMLRLLTDSVLAGNVLPVLILPNINVLDRALYDGS